jgi:hypothetical protein
MFVYLRYLGLEDAEKVLDTETDKIFLVLERGL